MDQHRGVCLSAGGSFFAFGFRSSDRSRGPEGQFLRHVEQGWKRFDCPQSCFDWDRSRWGSSLPRAALLSFDGKAIFYDVGTGIVQQNLASNEVRSVGEPAGISRIRSRTPLRFGGGSWFLKASDPSGPRIAIHRWRFLGKAPLWLSGIMCPTGPCSNWNPYLRKFLSFTAQAAFSPDGRDIYVAADITKDDAEDREAQCDLSLWDSHSGRLLIQRRIDGASARLAVSSDGRFAATACGKSVILWTSDLQRPLTTISISGNGWFPSMAFSPDSRSFAVHTGQAIVVYSISR